jgi:uncharacterized protein (TIGR03067 family)
MKLAVTMILTLGFLANLNGHAQDDAVKDEMKKLEGKWTRIYEESDGKKTEDGKKPPGKAVTLVIKGDKYEDMTFKVDPTKKPKHIDVFLVDKKGQTIRMAGIYELKDDVLKLCFSIPYEMKTDKLSNRPTRFTTKPGDDHGVEVFTRDK